MDETTIAAQDRVVRNYYETTSGHQGEISQADFERSLIPLQRRLGPWLDVDGTTIFDLGSGTGELCALAMQHGAKEAIGVNLSPGEIAFSRSRVPSARFVAQDVATFLAEQPAQCVDRIYALNILEHLDKDKLLALLEAAYRCLRPGGSLVAMVPNATSPFGSMTRYWDITHQCAFTPSAVRQIARLTGFEATFRECGPVVHGVPSFIRYALWRGIRALIGAYLLIEMGSTKGGIYTADMLFRLNKPEIA